MAARLEARLRVLTNAADRSGRGHQTPTKKAPPQAARIPRRHDLPQFSRRRHAHHHGTCPRQRPHVRQARFQQRGSSQRTPETHHIHMVSQSATRCQQTPARTRCAPRSALPLSQLRQKLRRIKSPIQHIRWNLYRTQRYTSRIKGCDRTFQPDRVIDRNPNAGDLLGLQQLTECKNGHPLPLAIQLHPSRGSGLRLGNHTQNSKRIGDLPSNLTRTARPWSSQRSPKQRASASVRHRRIHGRCRPR